MISFNGALVLYGIDNDDLLVSDYETGDHQEKSFGLFLIGLFGFTGDNPLVVLGLGLGLVIQGGYTLTYMTGKLRSAEPWARRALVVGQTLAIGVGLFGFVSSALYNINPSAGDYEYGPLIVGAVMTAQAAVALWLYSVRDQTDAVQAPPA